MNAVQRNVAPIEVKTSEVTVAMSRNATDNLSSFWIKVRKSNSLRVHSNSSRIIVELG
jgi:hypothetical protein